MYLCLVVFDRASGSCHNIYIVCNIYLPHDHIVLFVFNDGSVAGGGDGALPLLRQSSRHGGGYRCEVPGCPSGQLYILHLLYFLYTV